MMYIDGRWLGGAEREVVDPGTGRAFAVAAVGTRRHVDAAAKAARRALDAGWRRAPVGERAALLRGVADVIRDRNLELIELDCRNVGTPIRQGRDHLGLVPDVFRYYADLIEADAAAGPERVGISGTVVEREPVGVVAAIAPWNYPLWLASGKVAAAIAAGCAVILKPASLTPLSAIELARAFEAAGAPRGVFNLVLGPAATVGRALTSHPDVDAVSFTGGTESGLDVARRAMGRRVRHVGLELGGKSPNIVFEDADLAAAARGAIIGIYTNQGEVCSAGSRLLVERSIADDFVDRVVAAARALRIGYQLEEATEIGPLVSPDHLGRVVAEVAGAVHEGARILTGGRPHVVDGYEGGSYFEPTVLDNVIPSMRIAREEVFGPVLTIHRFDGEAEAIGVANGTAYGLAAGIWSTDEERLARVAREIAAGVVFLNSYHSAGLDVPWGGTKLSGIGRELGKAGLEAFSQQKALVRLATTSGGAFDTDVGPGKDL